MEKVRSYISNIGPTEAFIFNRNTEKAYVIHQKANMKIANSSIRFVSLVLRFANQEKMERKVKQLGSTLIDMGSDRILYYVLDI